MEFKIKSYNQDCITGINSLPDESIDCCITDPPYGIDYQSNRKKDKTKFLPKIENDLFPFIDFIEPVYKKIKVGGRLICFYRWDVQDVFLDEIKRVGFSVKSQIVWDKLSHGMGDLNGEFAPQHELMIYATKGRYEFKDKRPKSIYRVAKVSSDKLIHPNEKPINLMWQVINDITEIDELVLDPFAGSFATACACHLSGRRCITYELNAEVYDKGKIRLSEISGHQQILHRSHNPIFD